MINTFLETPKDGKSVLENELKKWGTEWNLSYVIILEDLLNDGLTRHQRNDDRYAEMPN